MYVCWPIFSWGVAPSPGKPQASMRFLRAQKKQLDFWLQLPLEGVRTALWQKSCKDPPTPDKKIFWIHTCHLYNSFISIKIKIPFWFSVQCPILEEPQSGRLTQTSDGRTTVATFTCLDGYTLIGNNVLACLSDSSWNATEPICGNIYSLKLNMIFNYTHIYNICTYTNVNYC